MNFKLKILLIGFIFPLFVSVIAQENEKDKMIWKEVAEMPKESKEASFGFAGCFAGVTNNHLVVAGGANFPNGLPWEGGDKFWSDKIFVLRKDSDNFSWISEIFRMPKSMAYGTSITTQDGVLCIGGRNGQDYHSDVFVIQFNPEENRINLVEYPSLPIPLAHSSAVLHNNVIYVIGGESQGSSTNYFFSLDLNNRESLNWGWKQLPEFPGNSRAFMISAVQSNGIKDNIYMFSGRSYNEKGNVEILQDALVYDFLENKWSPTAKEINFPVMAGNGLKKGNEYILFFSGSNGENFMKIKSLQDKLAEQNEENIELNKQYLTFLNSHKGFPKNIKLFNTITNKLSDIGNLPYGVVTAPLVEWEDSVYLISGEIRPGVRTPLILKGEIDEKLKPFGWLNTSVLLIYFLVLTFMGYIFSKRQKNVGDYFKGGGRVPWWIAGLSIFGTGLSAITFMAIPAKSFSTDWSYIWLNAGIILVAPLIIYYFIPIYRKLNITSVYEYLEIRFNSVIRLIGSISFIFFQIGRMGVVLFLPAIAINVVTGIDIYTCILAMGFFSLIYTIMGGIEAVVWTDALQVVVLLGGAILCLVMMILNFDGSISEMYTIAIEDDKINAFNMAFNFNEPTFWVVIFGGVFTSLATYGSDYTMVQRYLTTSSEKGAVKSLLTNVWLSIPATLLFFIIGTALYLFFKQHPNDMNISLSNGDSIFPWYIVNELPNGVVGLLISGILAAAMSSVSSSISSASTAYSIDIHFKFFEVKNELKTARISTLVIGVLGTLVAIFMAGFEIKSLWDIFNKVLGLIIGSMSGLFILGLFFKFANSKGALIGFISSIIIQFFISNYTNVHLLLYTATGMTSTVLFGIFFSLIFKQQNNINNKI